VCPLDISFRYLPGLRFKKTLDNERLGIKKRLLLRKLLT
jgi:hypothetical protein